MGRATHIEVQLLKNMMPFGRPSPSWIAVPDLTPEGEIVDPHEIFPMKIFPGSEGSDHHLMATFSHVRPAQDGWIAFHCELRIDGYPIGIERPGMLFEEPTDVPSAIIHYPILLPGDHTIFSGAYTLTVRTYRK